MKRNKAVSALKRIAQILTVWVVLAGGYIAAIVAYDVTVFGWLDLRKATLHKALWVPAFQTVFLCLAFACRFAYRRWRNAD